MATWIGAGGTFFNQDLRRFGMEGEMKKWIVAAAALAVIAAEAVTAAGLF